MTSSRAVFSRKYYLIRLRELGVTVSEDGRAIEQLDTDELAWEYARVKSKVGVWK